MTRNKAAEPNQYYDVLEVRRDASPEEIRKSYRRLARKYHPDVNPGDRVAEDRFKRIQEAYSVLNDPSKRKQYDRYGEYGVGQNSAGEGFGDFGFAGFDFSDVSGSGTQSGGFRDIFADLLGRRDAAGRNHKGRDLEIHVEVPFIDAVRGTQMSMDVNHLKSCRECRGSGGRPSAPQSCPACRGTGQSDRVRGIMRVAVPCRQCQGAGKVQVGDCSRCSGRGRIQTIEKIKLRIPAGVKTGSKVRVAGKGDAGEPGGAPGDLFLVIKVLPHPFFKREGNHIICLVPVTVTEAALGSEIEVPTVAGTARLKIPPGTQSGQKFRLRGRGVASSRGGGRGDELVEIRVVLPDRLTERSREILREFARLNPEDPRKDLGRSK